MKSRVTLCVAGLVMALLPGCCVFDALFGCGHYQILSCGASGCDDGCGHSKKCAKKCRKCRECLEEHGMAGMGGMGGEFYTGMQYGDIGGGDCGCGGGGMAGYPGGGCAGCGQPGGFDGGAVMTTPMMTVPTPGPTPMPHGGTALPPPIPPAETGSTVPQVPAGMQQVSVAEFQRLPGVIVSGPGSQAAQTAQAGSVPPAIVAAPAEAKPLDAVVITSPQSNSKQIQQAAWVPVQR